MSSMPPILTSEAVDSIKRVLLLRQPTPFLWLRHAPQAHLPRLHALLRTSSSSSSDALPASVQTALKGIAGDLAKATETVFVYRRKSRIFVLINCLSLSSSLKDRTAAIASWLTLTESSLHNDHHPELRKKISDFSRDMKQTHFNTSNIQTELTEQIKQLKAYFWRSSSVSERRNLSSLQRILDNWSVVLDVATLNWGHEVEEDVHILPFRNFTCPLTKEVMKEPVVVLESSQTYEKKAIEYWFERCSEDGRDPTCPVTGQVLKMPELKPNIRLAGAIEEWINRNVDVQVNTAVECFREQTLRVDCVEKVLDCIYRISEEHPSNRYKVRNAGVVLLIVKMLRSSSKIIGMILQTKILMALLSMAKDEESNKIMLEEGVTRLTIHSLIGSSEKEREYAVKLLLEFFSDETNCVSIASEKRGLVLLSSMAGYLENPALSNLAEEVLKKTEKIEEIIQHLAAAGRFEPLISRLCSDKVKIEMAFMVGRMSLTNSSKEQIARRSGLDDNATILVDAGVLPALTDILFKSQDAELNELAAATIANIVSNPGHWELASADKKGHSMQSEPIVSSLLSLLSVASPPCQVSVLRILCGIASSPQAVGSVADHIKSGDGIQCIIKFLEHSEVEHRVHACRLTRLLSERFDQDLAPQTSACPVHNAPCEDDNQLSLLKSNCIKPLVDLLVDEDTNVQIAAVEELSTLIIDTSKSLKRAIDELDKQGVLNAVIALFTEVRPGILQERAIWMIERILRVEGHSHRYLLNLSLVRTLVEAFKRGNANTKKHAQDTLTNLKQLSGVSRKASSQVRSRR
ncbi:hypothetical protein EZV62_002984 [Acer yangbiense]|uniref:RING-type E3 ubiquitin transferase n=1 Tax=Acer yangbiense TaxID=1000413 RepID=A0A5C7IYR2_9ROSI|nr:hypothetical protein EZV62_002984 [Acer yangbiense]